jgi:hypothetical protein
VVGRVVRGVGNQTVRRDEHAQLRVVVARLVVEQPRPVEALPGVVGLKGILVPAALAAIRPVLA